MVYWWGKAAKNEQRYKKQKAKNINRLIVNSKARKKNNERRGEREKYRTYE